VPLNGVRCNVLSTSALPAHWLAEEDAIVSGTPARSFPPPVWPPPSLSAPMEGGGDVGGAVGTQSDDGDDAGAAEGGDVLGAYTPLALSSPGGSVASVAGHGVSPATRRRARAARAPHRRELSFAALPPVRLPSELPAGGNSAVLMHIHGGGFVAGFWSTDALWLSQWLSTAVGRDVSVVYPHYSLSPEATYPTALNELYAVYAWLRRRFRRVCVSGDSAGGNLAAALTLLLIAEGQPVPDGVVLAYPALNLNPTPSASRSLHLNDPIVPVTLLSKLAASYIPPNLDGESARDAAAVPHPPPHGRQLPPVGSGGVDASEGAIQELPASQRPASAQLSSPPSLFASAWHDLTTSLWGGDAGMAAGALGGTGAGAGEPPGAGGGAFGRYVVTENWFMHPLYAPDAMLRQFPVTHLVAGGLDPLLDDCVDFNTRLRRLGVPGELQVHRSLPHGWLNFQFLTGAAEGTRQMLDMVASVLAIGGPATGGEEAVVGVEDGHVGAA